MEDIKAAMKLVQDDGKIRIVRVDDLMIVVQPRVVAKMIPKQGDPWRAFRYKIDQPLATEEE